MTNKPMWSKWSNDGREGDSFGILGVPLRKTGESIAGILQNNLKTVNDFIGAIGSEDVRGFHTLELLLFKDGKNRTIRN